MRERRPEDRRRPMLAVVLVVATIALAAVLLLIALFSDWSGQRRVSPIPVLAAVGVLVGGFRLAWRIANGPPPDGP